MEPRHDSGDVMTLSSSTSSQPPRPTTQVAVYRGVREIVKPSDRQLLNPDHLGSFDVVLTTFDVLARDLTHTDEAALSQVRAVHDDL